jgi:hypothetical protein
VQICDCNSSKRHYSYIDAFASASLFHILWGVVTFYEIFYLCLWHSFSAYTLVQSVLIDLVIYIVYMQAYFQARWGSYRQTLFISPDLVLANHFPHDSHFYLIKHRAIHTISCFFNCNQWKFYSNVSSLLIHRKMKLRFANCTFGLIFSYSFKPIK